jgi:hypothetical protein
MTMDNQQYLGWSNHSTWLVNFWLINNPSENKYIKQIIKIENKSNLDKFQIAEILKDYVIEIANCNLIGSASLASKLLGYAISQVNWLEIAERYLQEIETEMKKQEVEI